MTEKYTSTSMFSREVIDCRCLTLGVEFYRLSYTEVQELACGIIQWVSQLLGDSFVIKRTLNNRSVSEVRALNELEMAIEQRKWYSCIIEAIAICPMVYNLKTFREYFQMIKYQSVFPSPVTFGLATDYREYWDRLFEQGRQNDAETKEKILQIFREEGRYLKSYYELPDVQALLSVHPYVHCADQYRGSFDIDFSAHCLGDDLPVMADLFVRFARNMSETFVNINSRVMLQPIHGTFKTPYMQYFGGDPDFDNSHIDANCIWQEWYSTYYIPGVEWYNIVSPLAQSHLTKDHLLNKIPSLVFQNKLRGGCLEVGSTKGIRDYDISDALALKRMIYPALYPGKYSCPLSVFFNGLVTNHSMINFPRSNWAVIPVLEEELDVKWNRLTIEKRVTGDGSM